MGRATETELLGRLQKCKTFCINFPDPLLILDKKGVILDACDTVRWFFGVPADEIIGQSLFALPQIDEADRKVLQRVARNVFAGTPQEPPDIHIRTDQSDMIVQIITSPVKNEEGVSIFMLLRDVTDVRRAERDLKVSEHRYRELFDNMRSGVAVYEAVDNGSDFIFKDFNKAAQRSDKLSRAEVVGKRVTEVFPSVERVGFLQLLQRVYKTGTPEHFPPTLYEDERVGKVWWEDYVYKLPSGEVVAAFENITERMRASENLQDTVEKVMEERDKINTILHSIMDGVLVVDKDGKIMLMNESACRLTGSSKDESLHKGVEEILLLRFEEDGKSVDLHLGQVISTGRVERIRGHLLLVNREGERTPVSCTVAPLQGGEGVHGVVIVLRDVTKEREIDRMKTEFVSVASHQLHTPLTGMKWFLELLLREKAGPISDEQRKYLKQISASNERMITLVEDLLSVERIEVGATFSLTKAPTDVIRIIDEVIEDNIDFITEFQVQVVKGEEVPAQLSLQIDGEKIRQVFYNLISNAVKYSKGNGKVVVGCDTSQPDTVTFSVKDSGYGIPKRQQARVFQKFFRADNAVSKVAFGTGLGLYITRAVVEAHGGKVWFDSVEDVGTTFFFTLPKATAPAAANKRRRPRRTTRSARGKEMSA